MIYKIDIFEQKSHDSPEFYYGSITLETMKDNQWIFDYLHHYGGQLAIEGIEIVTFEFPNYTSIKITDFFRSGDFYRDLIYNSNEFRITNTLCTDISLTSEDENDLLIIGDDSVAELTATLGNNFHSIIENVSIIRSQYLYEWGATGLWEKYFTSIASGLTVKFIEKLASLGLSKNNIVVFKLQKNIKEIISKEYQINPDSLIIESYNKDENEIISVALRNSSIIFHVKLKNKELIFFKAEKLNKFV